MSGNGNEKKSFKWILYWMLFGGIYPDVQIDVDDGDGSVDYFWVIIMQIFCFVAFKSSTLNFLRDTLLPHTIKFSPFS